MLRKDSKKDSVKIHKIVKYFPEGENRRDPIFGIPGLILGQMELPNYSDTIMLTLQNVDLSRPERTRSDTIKPKSTRVNLDILESTRIDPSILKWISVIIIWALGQRMTDVNGSIF